MKLFARTLALLGLLPAACHSGKAEPWWEQGYPDSDRSGSGRSGSDPSGRGATVPASESLLSRSGRPAPPGAIASPPSSGALLATLNRTTVPGFQVEEEESLTAVVEVLGAATGLPLVVAPAAETAALDEGAVFHLRLSSALSARHVLDLIVEQAGPEVGWTIRHEVILVTTRAKAHGAFVIRAHDIHLLVAAQTDHVAPRLDRIRLIDEIEDEDGGGPFGSREQSAPRFEEDDVATLVQENIAVGTWEDDGVSISAENGVLFVVHAPEVQARIARFLSSLAGM